MLRALTSAKIWSKCLILGLLIAGNQAHALIHNELEWLKDNQPKILEINQQDNALSLVENALKQTQSERTTAAKIVENVNKSVSEIDTEVPKQLVSEVYEKQKEFSLEGFGLTRSVMGKIASNNGVNVRELLSKYNSKDFLEKENDKLPGLRVFISLGMPENSLKQLAAQVRKAKGILVLRGIYQGSLQKTIKAIYELNKQGVKAVIHPEYFKKYNITAVPAFVLENKSSCKLNKCTSIYDKLIGNVTLKYTLEQFYESGSNQSLAKQYLERMEEQTL